MMWLNDVEWCHCQINFLLKFVSVNLNFNLKLPQFLDNFLHFTFLSFRFSGRLWGRAANLISSVLHLNRHQVPPFYIQISNIHHFENLFNFQKYSANSRILLFWMFTLKVMKSIHRNPVIICLKFMIAINPPQFSDACKKY